VKRAGLQNAAPNFTLPAYTFAHANEAMKKLVLALSGFCDVVRGIGLAPVNYNNL